METVLYSSLTHIKKVSILIDVIDECHNLAQNIIIQQLANLLHIAKAGKTQTWLPIGSRLEDSKLADS